MVAWGSKGREARLKVGHCFTRPVRIRMQGGVAGAQSTTTVPYADWGLLLCAARFRCRLHSHFASFHYCSGGVRLRKGRFYIFASFCAASGGDGFGCHGEFISPALQDQG